MRVRDIKVGQKVRVKKSKAIRELVLDEVKMDGVAAVKNYKRAMNSELTIKDFADYGDGDITIDCQLKKHGNVYEFFHTELTLAK